MKIIPFLLFVTFGLRGQSDQLNILSYQLEMVIPFDHQGLEYPQNTLTAKSRIEFSSAQPITSVSLMLHRLLGVEKAFDEKGNAYKVSEELVSIKGWETFQLNHITLSFPPKSAGDAITLILEYRGHLSGYQETGMLYVQESLDPGFTIIRPESFSYPQLMEPTEESLSKRWRSDDKFEQQVSLTLPSTHRAATGYTLKNKTVVDSQVKWHYESPMPASGIVIPIAPYHVVERKGYNVYYFEEDEEGAKRIVSGIEKVHELYTKWMGSLKKQPNFVLAEIPDMYGSQVVMPTIIQTASAFRSPEAMGELYHEIGHFWNVRDTDLKSPRWNEGQSMFLQYLAYDELNERGSFIKSLTGRLERMKKYFDTHPEQISMSQYGHQGVTSSLSYGVGPLFFYVLSEVMGKEKLLAAMGEFYRQFEESGAGIDDLPKFLIKEDKKTKPVIDDWYYGIRYIELIKNANTVSELVATYKVSIEKED
ncbi:MAG: hypothetical protein AB7O48_10845 [Cyclobacteriaceae bacterium]